MIRFVVFSGESGDFIMHDNVVPRRFGADFREERFFRGFGESFVEGIVERAFASSGGVGNLGEFSVRVEQSIFDDVVSCLLESSLDLLDVTVFIGEVEVTW